jgi:frataxin-like iron-binding protein CyaY
MPNDSAYVFVDHNFMIGDADDFIKGFAIMERNAWELNVQNYLNCVEDNFDVEDPAKAKIEIEVNQGLVEISFDDYTVKPCTKKELEVFSRFFGESYSYEKEKGIMVSQGKFREPTYWIQYME